MVLAPEDVNRETNEVTDRLERIRTSIDALPGKLSPAAVAMFRLTTVRQQTHVRMRSQSLVLAPSAAATITVTIGGEAFVFGFASAIPVLLPFPRLVDRGIDAFATASAGTVEAWIVYTADE